MRFDKRSYSRFFLQVITVTLRVGRSPKVKQIFRWIEWTHEMDSIINVAWLTKILDWLEACQVPIKLFSCIQNALICMAQLRSYYEKNRTKIFDNNHHSYYTVKWLFQVESINGHFHRFAESLFILIVFCKTILIQLS